jgi:putative transposase
MESGENYPGDNQLASILATFQWDFGRRTRISTQPYLLSFLFFSFGKVIASLPTMRIPRRQSLHLSGIFHKMWRGHNREHVLESNEDKIAYLDCLALTLTEAITPFVAWHSYCLMGNHPHETGRLDFARGHADCLNVFGNWMRNAHSRFGAGYNRRHNRQGKVAYDRPKTKEVDAKGGLLEVMFYGDANPVKAGMVSHPSRYRFSSYAYYAYGRKNRFTEKLTPPPEYLALGNSPEERQRRYRERCDAYLREHGLIADRPPEPSGDGPRTTLLQNSEVPSQARGDPAEP